MDTKSIQLFLCLILLATLCGTLPAYGELQNVQVGGELRILGEYYRNADTPGDGIRWPAFFLPGRPIGDFGADVESWFGGDDHGPSYALVTQWTRLNATATFTDGVSAFIELDALHVWGEDFRSGYLTGADSITPTDDDLEVYQAYIDAAGLFGLPLRARIGRQELRFGSEWLVGANDDGSDPVWGLSFDGIRLTYATDQFSIDGWWSKIAERSPVEEDGDADFCGIYASYYGRENLTIDAYWLWLRDGVSVNDTDSPWFDEWIEDLQGIDDYDATNIHTVGLRAAGEVGGFDYEAEAAYQWGEAALAGSSFAALTYGDDSADYAEWACTLELGYTFDCAWEPRAYLGYTYFGGEDNRDISFGEWLSSPSSADASLSFNRLFSNACYSYIFDETDLSNVHVFRAGASAMVTERVEIGLDGLYLLADEPFDAPVHFTLGRYRIPIAPALGFWTRENDDELGLELTLYGWYEYSEDLEFEVGWTHLFVGDGLREGSFVSGYGLEFLGGTGDDGVDYLYFETMISF